MVVTHHVCDLAGFVNILSRVDGVLLVLTFDIHNVVMGARSFGEIRRGEVDTVTPRANITFLLTTNAVFADREGALVNGDDIITDRAGDFFRHDINLCEKIYGDLGNKGYQVRGKGNERLRGA